MRKQLRDLQDRIDLLTRAHTGIEKSATGDPGDTNAFSDSFVAESDFGDYTSAPTTAPTSSANAQPPSRAVTPVTPSARAPAPACDSTVPAKREAAVAATAPAPPVPAPGSASAFASAAVSASAPAPGSARDAAPACDSTVPAKSEAAVAATDPAPPAPAPAPTAPASTLAPTSVAAEFVAAAAASHVSDKEISETVTVSSDSDCHQPAAPVFEMGILDINQTRCVQCRIVSSNEKSATHHAAPARHAVSLFDFCLNLTLLDSAKCFFDKESQVLMFAGLNIDSKKYAEATGEQPPGASDHICVCAGFLLSRSSVDGCLLKNCSVTFRKYSAVLLHCILGLPENMPSTEHDELEPAFIYRLPDNKSYTQRVPINDFVRLITGKWVSERYVCFSFVSQKIF